MPYRYQNTKIQTADYSSDQMYSNNIYPDIPVVNGDNYVITTLGDRLDILAKQFYGDESFWWIIASANSLPGDSLHPTPGTQLRIPADSKAVFDQYRQFNANR
jgi:nucleoid-associated protein YgaU